MYICMYVSIRLRSNMVSKETPTVIWQLICKIVVFVCERIHQSKGEYVSHLKGHHYNRKQTIYASLPHFPVDNTCFDWNNVFMSSSRPRRYMAVHRGGVRHADAVNSIKDTEFICHICLISMKQNAGLKSHLRDDRNETEAIASGTKSEWASHQSNVWQWRYMYICIHIGLYSHLTIQYVNLVKSALNVFSWFFWTFCSNISIKNYHLITFQNFNTGS